MSEQLTREEMLQLDADGIARAYADGRLDDLLGKQTNPEPPSMSDWIRGRVEAKQTRTATAPSDPDREPASPSPSRSGGPQGTPVAGRGPKPSISAYIRAKARGYSEEVAEDIARGR